MINILMSRSEALVSNYAKDYIKDILKPDMKVIIVFFSYFNNLDEETYFEYYGLESEYLTKIKDNFSEYNITSIEPIYYYNQSREEQLKLINNADVIYFPGGAPDLMMERIKEKELLDAFNNFNKIIIGSSAGAMIQLKNYHISKDNEYFKFKEYEGLNYIDEFFIEVHFERRRPQKSSMRKMHKKYLKPVYIIPDDGMLVVNNKEVISLGSAKKYYNKKGINK